MQDALTIDAGADHLGAEAHLRKRGWSHCGQGDWAIALRSPSGRVAARISPFDPTARFTAQLYRAGVDTGWFPKLFLERPLAGGANLLLMEFLYPLDESTGAAVHRRLREKDPGILAAASLIEDVHRMALDSLPWCGPIDDNPSNIMAALDGSPRITDPYLAAGPALYGALARAPLEVASAIPPEERRHILDIPLASSGKWKSEERRRMQDALARADALLAIPGGAPSEHADGG